MLLDFCSACATVSEPWVRRVVDHGRADLVRARRRVDDRVRRDLALVDRQRDDERLDRRAGLERVDHRAVAQLLAGESRAVVRVERRIVREREDFAVLRIEHDDAAGHRVVLEHGGLQLAERELLDAPVDRQLDRRAVLRGHERPRVGDDPAEPVANHLALARRAGQQRVRGELDAFLPLILDVREADHVCGRFAFRIEALRIGDLRDAVDRELVEAARGLGVDLALEQHEGLVVAEAALHFGERHVEQLRDLRIVGVGHLLRVRPDLVGREADREHRAIAVDDAPAHRVELDRALVTLLALTDVEILIRDLHPERAHDQRGERDEHENHDELRAPHRQARREHRIFGRGRVRVDGVGLFLRAHAVARSVAGRRRVSRNNGIVIKE